MTDEKLKSHEKRAADELQAALLNRINGKRAGEVATIAEVQAALANAALQGLVELLVHKGVVSADDLSIALRRSYQRTYDRMGMQESTLIVPDSVIARVQ